MTVVVGVTTMRSSTTRRWMMAAIWARVEVSFG